MCGIVGYVGHRRALDVLLEGLERLEYRGYDSVGVAVVDHELRLAKTAGRVERLKSMPSLRLLEGTSGVGHTRWATHGAPNDQNAHPHLDCHGTIGVVHNGIVDNYATLKAELQSRGHRFASETDTEVLAHLIEERYRGDLAQAVREAVAALRGSWALGVVSRHEPGVVVVARWDSPLVVGLGDGECVVGSDVTALVGITRKVIFLQNGDVARIHRDGVQVWDGAGRPVQRPVTEVAWDRRAAEKGGYPHFMLKEIHEQPAAVRATLAGRVRAAKLQADLGDAGLDEAFLRRFRRVCVVACGTAWHAGLVGKRLIEGFARLPVEVDLASEFRYRRPLVGPETLTVAVSQSGETADTLAAVREARRLGSPVLAICNVEGSSISREADRVLYTRAGPEVAVASTKAYLAQLVAFYLLAARMSGAEAEARLVQGLIQLPPRIEQVLAQQEQVVRLAQGLADSEHLFYIGRGVDHAVAMEGALKLKEISYVHAEAYAAGELKHGTLALIEPGRTVVALSSSSELRPKLVGNVAEVKARGARVVGIGPRAGPQQEELAALCDAYVALPDAPEDVLPVLAAVPLQLLAYHVAVARGCDVDRPRNLAKSVTVE